MGGIVPRASGALSQALPLVQTLVTKGPLSPLLAQEEAQSLDPLLAPQAHEGTTALYSETWVLLQLGCHALEEWPSPFTMPGVPPRVLFHSPRDGRRLS